MVRLNMSNDKGSVSGFSPNVSLLEILCQFWLR